MRKTLITTVLMGAAALPLAAQGGGMAGGRFGPPPNHWMTMDSVAQALSLTAAEKAAIQVPYDSINALLMRAQTIRDSIRSHFQGGGDFRAMVAAARQVLQPLQDQEDALVKELRGKISAAAGAKLDAAPPPRVLRERPGGMRRPPGR